MYRVRWITGSDLTDTDNTVPFENTSITPINQNKNAK